MIAGYIGLGAWLLALVITGLIVITTGLPDKVGNDDEGPALVCGLKFAYLVALSFTMYQIGEHFSNL